MRIDRAMGTSQEILRSNRRVDLRVSFLGAFVPWTRATLCFKATMRLITCGPSGTNQLSLEHVLLQGILCVLLLHGGQEGLRTILLAQVVGLAVQLRLQAVLEVVAGGQMKLRAELTGAVRSS